MKTSYFIFLIATAFAIPVPVVPSSGLLDPLIAALKQVKDHGGSPMVKGAKGLGGAVSVQKKVEQLQQDYKHSLQAKMDIDGAVAGSVAAQFDKNGNLYRGGFYQRVLDRPADAPGGLDAFNKQRQKHGLAPWTRQQMTTAAQRQDGDRYKGIDAHNEQMKKFRAEVSRQNWKTPASPQTQAQNGGSSALNSAQAQRPQQAQAQRQQQAQAQRQQQAQAQRQQQAQAQRPQQAQAQRPQQAQAQRPQQAQAQRPQQAQAQRPQQAQAQRPQQAQAQRPQQAPQRQQAPRPQAQNQRPRDLST
ncbi:hypothetical protein TWF694_010207 [Orbilia ellipsospora]|uniref:Uncharacterized protein n=1 Tax=Orbilia ellipsospora TaxID=2528407 RepID=A0AAV9X966_9PEZI